MKWSIRLGSLVGIPVHLHATFLILLGLVAISQGLAGGLGAALGGVVFVTAIFGCVVLHEFGHALAARHYGIRTRDVTLLPIGGVARLERMPADPRKEFWVAIAGPAVNVAIAGLLGIWLSLTGPGSFAARLLTINLGLVVFNMLPAFPMDGGRVLRALLARRTSYVRATETAAAVGKAMALLFAVVGLFWNPMLILIALFVWAGGSAEAEMARQRAAFEASPIFARYPLVYDLEVDPLSTGGSRPVRFVRKRRLHRVGPWLVHQDD